MTNLEPFASKFHNSANSLRRFDEALIYFKRMNIQRNSAETLDELRKLLFVLKPIAELLDGRLSRAVDFDEQSIVEILQQRHARDWQKFSEQIIELANKFGSENANVSKNDFEILNDIADAIGVECANLFRRISGRA